MQQSGASWISSRPPTVLYSTLRRGYRFVWHKWAWRRLTVFPRSRHWRMSLSSMRSAGRAATSLVSGPGGIELGRHVRSCVPDVGMRVLGFKLTCELHVGRVGFLCSLSLIVSLFVSLDFFLASLSCASRSPLQRRLVSLLLGCGVRDRLRTICLPLLFYRLRRMNSSVGCFQSLRVAAVSRFGCPFEFPAQEANQRHFISLRTRGAKVQGLYLPSTRSFARDSSFSIAHSLPTICVGLECRRFAFVAVTRCAFLRFCGVSAPFPATLIHLHANKR